MSFWLSLYRIVSHIFFVFFDIDILKVQNIYFVVLLFGGFLLFSPYQIQVIIFDQNEI